MFTFQALSFSPAYLRSGVYKISDVNEEQFASFQTMKYKIIKSSLYIFSI